MKQAKPPPKHMSSARRINIAMEAAQANGETRRKADKSKEHKKSTGAKVMESVKSLQTLIPRILGTDSQPIQGGTSHEHYVPNASNYYNEWEQAQVTAAEKLKEEAAERERNERAEKEQRQRKEKRSSERHNASSARLAEEKKVLDEFTIVRHSSSFLNAAVDDAVKEVQALQKEEEGRARERAERAERERAEVRAASAAAQAVDRAPRRFLDSVVDDVLSQQLNRLDTAAELPKQDAQTQAHDRREAELAELAARLQTSDAQLMTANYMVQAKEIQIEHEREGHEQMIKQTIERERERYAKEEARMCADKALRDHNFRQVAIRRSEEERLVQEKLEQVKCESADKEKELKREHSAEKGKLQADIKRLEQYIQRVEKGGADKDRKSQELLEKARLTLRKLETHDIELERKHLAKRRNLSVTESKLQEEVKCCGSERARLKGRVERLEQDIQQVKRESANKEKKLRQKHSAKKRELQADIERLDEYIQQVEKGGADKDRKSKELLEKARLTLQDLHAEDIELGRKHLAERRNFSVTESKLQQEVKRCGSERARLEGHIERLEQDIQQVAKGSASKDSTLRQLHAQDIKLRQDFDIALRLFEADKQKSFVTESKLQEEVKHCMTERAQLQTDIEGLQQDIQQVRQSADKDRRSKELLEPELKEALEQLQAEKQRALVTETELRENVKRCETERARLQGDNQGSGREGGKRGELEREYGTPDLFQKKPDEIIEMPGPTEGLIHSDRVQGPRGEQAAGPPVLDRVSPFQGGDSVRINQPGSTDNGKQATFVHVDNGLARVVLDGGSRVLSIDQLARHPDEERAMDRPREVQRQLSASSAQDTIDTRAAHGIQAQENPTRSITSERPASAPGKHGTDRPKPRLGLKIDWDNSPAALQRDRRQSTTVDPRSGQVDYYEAMQAKRSAAQQPAQQQTPSPVAVGHQVRIEEFGDYNGQGGTVTSIEGNFADVNLCTEVHRFDLNDLTILGTVLVTHSPDAPTEDAETMQQINTPQGASGKQTPRVTYYANAQVRIRTSNPSWEFNGHVGTVKKAVDGRYEIELDRHKLSEPIMLTMHPSDLEMVIKESGVMLPLEQRPSFNGHVPLFEQNAGGEIDDTGFQYHVSHGRVSLERPATVQDYIGKPVYVLRYTGQKYRMAGPLTLEKAQPKSVTVSNQEGQSRTVEPTRIYIKLAGVTIPTEKAQALSDRERRPSGGGQTIAGPVQRQSTMATPSSMPQRPASASIKHTPGGGADGPPAFELRRQSTSDMSPRSAPQRQLSAPQRQLSAPQPVTGREMLAAEAAGNFKRVARGRSGRREAQETAEKKSTAEAAKHLAAEAKGIKLGAKVKITGGDPVHKGWVGWVTRVSDGYYTVKFREGAESHFSLEELQKEEESKMGDKVKITGDPAIDRLEKKMDENKRKMAEIIEAREALRHAENGLIAQTEQANITKDEEENYGYLDVRGWRSFLTGNESYAEVHRQAEALREEMATGVEIVRGRLAEIEANERTIATEKMELQRALKNEKGQRFRDQIEVKAQRYEKGRAQGLLSSKPSSTPVLNNPGLRQKLKDAADKHKWVPADPREYYLRMLRLSEVDQERF